MSRIPVKEAIGAGLAVPGFVPAVRFAESAGLVRKLTGLDGLLPGLVWGASFWLGALALVASRRVSPLSVGAGLLLSAGANVAMALWRSR